MTFGAADSGTGGAPEATPVARAEEYDRFVDWPRRLEREAPFFRGEFQEHGVRSVIDVGTGSGMHAAMWARWGLDVTGVDPDAAMLEQARHNAALAAEDVADAGGSLRFVTGGFGGLDALGLGPVDAVTCTGNALPHIAGPEALVPTLRDFAAVLRPGGIVVLHLLNHDRMLAQRIRAIPPVVREGDDGTWVFLRIADYVEDAIRFDFITMHRPLDAWESGAAWETKSRRARHTGLPSATLLAGLAEAGFRDVETFGAHDGSPLRPDADESIIIVAVKAG